LNVRGCWFTAAVLLWFASANALAHTKSETHSVWQISGSSVAVIVTVPVLEAARLALPDEQQPPDARLLDYLRDHTGARSGGADCVPESSRVLAATPQFRRFELHFSCPTNADIRLHSSAFFELVPSHVNFAQIQTDDGQFVEQLFTKEHQELVPAGGDARLRDAGFWQYLRLGVLHILSGPDHMAFLLGLILISRRLRDLIYVVSGFTVGHSVTLALAVSGVLRPHAEYIDALVALTIAMIGAENIALSAQRSATVAVGIGATLLLMAAASVAGLGTLPPLLLLGAALFCSNYLMLSGHLPDAARLRVVTTFVFGLIHGFGFATALLEMRLSTAQLARMLVGFNVGVELGQVGFVLAVVALVALLMRVRVSLPRPIVVDGVAAGLVAVGTYWFIRRSYG
jgi:hypothetical protein